MESKRDKLEAYLESTWNLGEYHMDCPNCGRPMSTVEETTDGDHYHDLTCTRCGIDISHMFRFSHATGRVVNKKGQHDDDNKGCADVEDVYLRYAPLQQLRFAAKAFGMLDPGVYHHSFRDKEKDWISELLRGLADKVPKEDWPLIRLQGAKENPLVLALAKEALGA